MSSVIPIEPQRFADRPSSWLASTAPDSDVVISSRVRLARNVEGYPFVPRLDADRAVELCSRLGHALTARRIDGETLWVEIDKTSPMLRLLLRERYLVSRDLAPADERRTLLPGRAVGFGASETLAVMVNEEDHLRIQSLATGLAVRQALERARVLDRDLETELEFSHSPGLGYLTSCPTNVGTGLRASVMLHLPALSMARPELEKVFQAASRTGLAVRGMYGEGSRAAGDLYQISNQVTLGRSEDDLVEDLNVLVPSIVDFERRMRRIRFEESRAALSDRIHRAVGTLAASRAMSTEVALMNLSLVRLGECLGLYKGLPLAEMNQLAVQIQRGHVQAMADGLAESELVDSTERDRLRASFLRRRFAARR